MIELDELYVTLFACVMAPVEALIASTNGTDMKFVPVIVIDVAALVIVSGLILEIVGNCVAVIDSPFTVNALVEIVPAVLIVSPLSPMVNVVPVLGLILFTFTSLIYFLMVSLARSHC